MKYELLVRPEAEEDLRRAYLWYEDKRSGLGDDFLLCIETALSQILKNPLQYSYLHRELRRALVRRFPYAIFYVVSSQVISVIAVLHCRRDPETWGKRMVDAKPDDKTKNP